MNKPEPYKLGDKVNVLCEIMEVIYTKKEGLLYKVKRSKDTTEYPMMLMVIKPEDIVE